MTILDRLLDEVRLAKGPISSTDLARRLDTSAAALSGMLSVLESMGKLTGDGSPSPEIVACSGAACGTTCVGLDACPFIAAVPTTHRLVIAPPMR